MFHNIIILFVFQKVNNLSQFFLTILLDRPI
nr:MAG TPA: hypothetical protein [Caudoviricetes sp.]